ncbi:hypothetical protein AB0B50_09480 [Streptomyces sp. NPDC041068]|uniref:hypothetical protein n=1 Tax=Streptomyces sp. NPDC041068 TaxID=3155130 RepID=UPI0033C7FAD2
MRGAPWWSRNGHPLRADPMDRDRLPADTWQRAEVPAGRRVEFVARGVRAVETSYAASPPLEADGYRTTAAVFTLLTTEGAAQDTPAAPGRHVARVELPHPDGEFTTHLPKTLRPAPRELRPLDGGTLTPVPDRPRCCTRPHGRS